MRSSLATGRTGAGRPATASAPQRVFQFLGRDVSLGGARTTVAAAARAGRSWRLRPGDVVAGVLDKVVL